MIYGYNRDKSACYLLKLIHFTIHNLCIWHLLCRTNILIINNKLFLSLNIPLNISVTPL